MASNHKQEERSDQIEHYGFQTKPLVKFGPHHFPVGTKFKVADRVDRTCTIRYTC